MKRHLSVAALWVRCTIVGAAVVIISMCAVEAGLLFWCAGLLRREAFPMPFFPGEMAERAYLPICFKVSVALMAVYFLIVRSSHSTVGRLRIDERAAALWYAGVCAGWFIVLWAAQVGMVLALYAIYADAVGGVGIYRQTLFIAEYESSFFLWVMPLANIRTPLVLIFFLLLGFSVGEEGRRRRLGLGKFPVATVIITAAALYAIGRDPESGGWVMPFLTAAVAFAVELHRFLKRREDE